MRVGSWSGEARSRFADVSRCSSDAKGGSEGFGEVVGVLCHSWVTPGWLTRYVIGTFAQALRTRYQYLLLLIIRLGDGFKHPVYDQVSKETGFR